MSGGWLIALMLSAPWLFPLLLPAGLLAPGWLLGRALRAPAGPAGTLLGSAALLTNLVLVFDALHVPIDTAHLAIGLGVVCALLAGAAAWHRLPGPPAAAVPGEKTRWTRSQCLLIPAAIGLVAIAWRAIFEPLSGYDTFFRWDFLAREILRVGHLQFYPAVTADDFLHYSWADGIAPLISTLYLWTYCSFGRMAPWLTAPIVLAQAALLFWLVWQLATRRGGATAGLVAMALLATNTWALWSVAMGQETGCTALGLLGMFYFFERTRTEPEGRWPLWAGIAAGVGALAREYGLVFIALGWATIAWQRISRRGWFEFSLAAIAVAAPWYLRNWVRTGNPLWSHNLGGLLPTNPMLLDYNQALAGLTSILVHPDHLIPAAALLALAMVPMLMAAAGAFTQGREAKSWVFAIITLTVLWLWSIGQTSGGTAYSIRMLGPAFALGAVLGGCWLRRWATPSRAPWLAALLAALAADAALRSLFLPFQPDVAWWRQPIGSWSDFGRSTERWHTDPNWKIIAAAAEGQKILVSDPSCHAILLSLGAKPVPFFSPEVFFLFGDGPAIPTRLTRLRELGYRFIIITRDNSVQDAQAPRHPIFQALQNMRPAGSTWLYFIYDLYALAPLAEPTASARTDAR